MRIEVMPVRGLKSTVSINDGINVELPQSGVANATCWIGERGSRPFKVTADDGIAFTHASGMRLVLADRTDITELCDLDQLAAEIEDLDEARAEQAKPSRAAARRMHALEA